MNAIAQITDVPKKNLEVIATYMLPEQKKVLEQWASKERRSVSNLVAGILADALENHQNGDK
jgi:hypothetical protein